MPNVIEITETICGRTAIRIHGRTYKTGFIRSSLSKSRPNNDTYIFKHAAIPTHSLTKSQQVISFIHKQSKQNCHQKQLDNVKLSQYNIEDI